MREHHASASISHSGYRLFFDFAGLAADFFFAAITITPFPSSYYTCTPDIFQHLI